MKYLPALLLFVLCMPLWADAQQEVRTAGGKVAAEIIATTATAVVKGSPFSAEAVNESIQTLPDGNKITRSYTTRMYRDSEGRFRREGGSSIGGFGNAVTFGNAVPALGLQDTVSIFDPVSNQRYIINPSDKTVRRMPTIAGIAEGAVIVNGQSLSHAVKTRIESDAAKQLESNAAKQSSHVVVLPSVNGAATTGTFTTATSTWAGKGEPLGTRSFDGVEAEGTRTVTTIPAGSIGNERDIEIVYERWYSKDLQLIVYSRHSDPRFGEQIYRLTNINRSEPDRSLFTPPADYKVVAEPTFNVVRTKSL
ncbi:MAG TPA: hypothetical protein VF556_06640 [Pyrinomonadaceae bacterium]|jgi:hypothetical protein